MDNELIKNTAIGISLIAITVIIGILVFLSKWCIATKKKTLNPLVNLVYYFIYVKLFLYYLIPAILRLWSDFQFEKQDGVFPIDVLYIYLIELLSWFFWIILFSLIIYQFRNKINYSNNSFFLSENIIISKFAVIFIGAGFLTLVLFSLFKLDFPQELELFKSIFFYCGITIGPILVVLSSRYFGQGYVYFGLILCIVSVITIPTRGALVYMFLFFYFLAWKLQNNKKLRVMLTFASLLLVSFYFIVGSLMSGLVAVDATGAVTFEFSTTAEKSGSRTAFEEIEWRFGASTRMGTAFVTMFNKSEGAGILPIKHSLMGLIPRSLNPEKPIPSTIDPEDIYSQGMYLISREINGYDTYSMTEFPTGAHFYWEFGLLGVVVLSLISALYISICVILFSKFGIFGLSIMIATFKPWGYMDPKIWVSDLVMQIYQVILPGILLIFMINFLLIGCLYLKKYLMLGLHSNK